MLNPTDQLAMLKLIDERQLQVLEDLNRLSTRIEGVIELHSSNRGPVDSNPPADDTASGGDQGSVRPDVAA